MEENIIIDYINRANRIGLRPETYLREFFQKDLYLHLATEILTSEFLARMLSIVTDILKTAIEVL